MNTYQEKRQKLEDRTIKFSVAIIKTCGHYASKPGVRPLIDQIIRSSTSVGANYAEANNASSKADFRSKIYIAKKEIAETRYWLKVLVELIPDEDFSTLQKEAEELNLIFQKVISTIQNGDKNGK